MHQLRFFKQEPQQVLIIFTLINRYDLFLGLIGWQSLACRSINDQIQRMAKASMCFGASQKRY